MDLSRVANRLSPSTSKSEAERVTIDNSLLHAPIHGFPNAEHTVIVDSKRGNRDRAPKALTLRQSVQAHLSLPKTQLLKVSSPPDEPEDRTSGPPLRHGRPSLLERISGMEEVLHNEPVSVSSAHIYISTGPYKSPPQSNAMHPQRSAGTNRDINLIRERSTNIDSQHPDHISNITYDNNFTAHAICPNRAPRADTDYERTHVGLAKMKNVVATVIPSAAPRSPSISSVPSTPAGPGETTPPSPLLANLRSKLLEERLDRERKRAIGAASGELQVEPVVGNISEDSLRAELRARNRLRTRLIVAKGDRHVDILEP